MSSSSNSAEDIQIIPSNAFVYPLPAISLEKFDIGGVLYHANYFHLLEQSREALLAKSGTPYPSLVKKNQHLAIVTSKQEFLAPITYGQAIDIAVWASEVRKTSCILHYVLITSVDSATVHLASTKLVFVSIKDSVFKITKFPEKLKNALDGISIKP